LLLLLLLLLLPLPLLVSLKPAISRKGSKTTPGEGKNSVLWAAGGRQTWGQAMAAHRGVRQR
jgi:hypothetical protein